MCNLMIIKANENSKEVKEILPIPLKKLEAKHIPYINNKTNILHANAVHAGYTYDVFGSHRSYTELPDEVERIKNMSFTPCLRAVRIVLTTDGKIWSDNTHWTIAYMLKYGWNTQLKEIPFYIVDFCHDIPTVIDYNHTLFDSITEIRNAVKAAQNIQERIGFGWRAGNLSYKIEELATAILGKKQGENDG